MKIPKAEAETRLRDQFCRDFTSEQRREMSIDSPVLINWLWQYQSKSPQMAATLGGEIHQIRKSLLGLYVGP